MAPTTLTLNYNAILASTLFNYQKGFVKNVGLSNAFYYMLQKSENGYVGKSTIGERAAIPLMYAVGTADSYSGFDILSVAPMDGFTTAFYDWRQAAIPCTISGDEELKNDGEAKLFDLLKGKILQAEMGIKQFFNTAALQGRGGILVQLPYVSGANGSVFVDPLYSFVQWDPVTGATAPNPGQIPQATEAWWRNQSISSVAATFIAFRNELRHLFHLCTMATPKGPPNLHMTSLEVFELYERCLEAFHQNPTMDADIPFDNVKFKGKPVVYDEEFCDGGATPCDVNATGHHNWVMLNTEFFQVQYHNRRNFAPTNMQTPTNQDARISHILWYGAMLCSNRGKQGILYDINEAIIV